MPCAWAQELTFWTRDRPCQCGGWILPAISATLLSGQLAVVLARRGGGMPKRPAVLASVWAVVLLTAAAAFGRTGLGSALAVAFLLQVTPSVWTVAGQASRRWHSAHSAHSAHASSASKVSWSTRQPTS